MKPWLCLAVLSGVLIAHSQSLLAPFNPSPADRATKVDAQPVLGWASGNNALTNGGFEDLFRTWTRSVQGVFISANLNSSHAIYPPILPIEGNRMGVLTAIAVGTNWLTKRFEIPPKPGRAWLSWSDRAIVQSFAPEVTGAGFRDYRVILKTQDGARTRVLHANFGEPDSEIDWIRHRMEVSEFAGQTVEVTFEVLERSGRLTVLVDDVRLEMPGQSQPRYRVFFGNRPDLDASDLLTETSALTVSVPRLEPGSTNWWQVVATDSSGTIAGPVWSFVVGEQGKATSLNWGSVPRSIEGGAEFTARIEATDKFGNIDPQFNASAELLAGSAGVSAPEIVISEVGRILGFGMFVELHNPSNRIIDLSGWRLSVYDQPHWPAVATTFSFPPNSWVPAGQTVVVGFGVGTLTMPGLRFDGQAVVNWGTAPTNQLVAAFVQDSSGLAVDFVAVGGADPSQIQNPVVVSPTEWMGNSLSGVTNTTWAATSWNRITDRDTNSAADWGLNYSSPGGSWVLKYQPSPRYSPVSPGRIEFTNGVWTGSITLFGGGLESKLIAFAPRGPRGESAGILIKEAVPTYSPIMLKAQLLGREAVRIETLDSFSSKDRLRFFTGSLADGTTNWIPQNLLKQTEPFKPVYIEIAIPSVGERPSFFRAEAAESLRSVLPEP